ncbi:unnamed protein product [Rotaria magnacalcarata]|uniref:TIR domain-containing protein n=2 Tax=Rotaria magnacalcarata TaxID=392030 RepID=A0A815XZ46_9BILA|nr:unnamed protein product [Rotaria magnacalcarata]CAF1563599.1 unnamed protein product [Rotaria magnacalcarata]CAF3856483.1 unnamed protein product [Rotaria magnacalcarata]CAF4010698.1 unnamed protein product [Rotaria magnacalcarata]
MAENDSTTLKEKDSNKSTKRTPNYFKLLQEIDNTLKLLTDSNSSHLVTRETSHVSEIEEILHYVNINLDEIIDKMTDQKRAMSLITVFNIVIRMCTIDEIDFVISLKSFQSMIRKALNKLEIIAQKEPGNYKVYAGDMLDSILMNLAEDNLMQTCFERLCLNQNKSIKNSIENDEEKEENIDYNELIAKYMECASSHSFMVNLRSVYEFGKNYHPVISSMLKFIDKYLTDGNNENSSMPLEIITQTLSILWSLSDKIVLVPLFAELGCAKKSIQWIATNCFAFHIKTLGDAIFSIVHNLSRDKTGLTQLRNEKAFEVLMKYKQLVEEQNDEDLKLSYGMALISVTVSDEQPEENKEFIIWVSRTLYGLCKITIYEDDLRYNGCHLSELLELLHQAFANTYVVKDILSSESNDEVKPVAFFAQCLLSIYGALLDKEVDDLEKRAAKYLLKILLQISNYHEYHKELTEINQFCVIIEGLSKRPKQDDAKRIWSNLQGEISSNQLKKEKSSMIYISYDRSDEKFCESFIGELRKRTSIPVWVDFEHVESWDDMWEYVLPVIQSATVIIPILSTAYGENTDKFQEVSYAIGTSKSQDKSKKLIAVTTEPDFSFNRAWMEDLIGEHNLVPFDNNTDNVVFKVCAQIIHSKKPLMKCFPRITKRS